MQKTEILKILKVGTKITKPNNVREISSSSQHLSKKGYKIVIVGGGSGGCTMAAKFANKMGNRKLAVIEPSDVHYYQPMWTLVGGGIKTLEESGRPMGDVLPRNAVWIKDRVTGFSPEKNRLQISNGDEICYEYLIVAMGLQLDFSKIKGLPEALSTPGVCSNYSSETVSSTFEAIKNFKRGNAIFTYPNTPIKCAGAPQKIMYLTEDYFRTHGIRENSKVMYNTSLDVIFGVKKYAAELRNIISNRGIIVNYKHNLVEVLPDSKQAVFERVDKPDSKMTYEYELLHVTPPMSAPDVLKSSTLVDNTGYLNINKKTLQHHLYPNVFGIGDCTNLPTSRTVAAIAAESGVLRKNLSNFMDGKPLEAHYDGYTSCPLVTAFGRCILAEFDYELQPLETFPVNQGIERWSMYALKKEMMPTLYWQRMLRGKWEGPRLLRRLMHLGLKK